MLRAIVICLLIQNVAVGQNLQFPVDLSQFTNFNNFFGNFPPFVQNQNNNNVNNNGVSVDDRGSFGEIVKPDASASTLRPPVADSEQCNCVPYHECSGNRRNVDFNSNNKIEIQFVNATCEHYLDVCCGAGDVSPSPNPQPSPQPNPVQPTVVPQPVQPSPATPPRPEPVSLPGCGVRNVGGIDFTVTDVDAKFAGFGEFPWTVALIDVNTGTCDCAGSLILPQVVLTAGHCMKNAQALKVRAGEWDTQTDKERLPFQERRVSQVIPHKMFNSKNLNYDLALIILDSPFALDRHINTVCLPPQDYRTLSNNCFATGWGKDQFGKAGIYSVMLKKVPLPIVPHATCQNKLRTTRLTKNFNLHSSFLCAGGVPGTDTCEGDGGAPLHCPADNNPNQFVQTGVVAWGIGCNTDVPAVYANVASMRNWIDETLQSLNFDITPYTAY